MSFRRKPRRTVVSRRSIRTKSKPAQFVGGRPQSFAIWVSISISKSCKFFSSAHDPSLGIESVNDRTALESKRRPTSESGSRLRVLNIRS